MNERDNDLLQQTSIDLSMDWDSVPAAEIAHCTISDALVLSLSNFGRVDIDYIAKSSGFDSKTVISALKGAIYQNPEVWGGCLTKGWETAEEYLSGNLLRKRKAAAEADKAHPGCFRENIRAIDRVLPPVVGARNIYVTLGSPWVPTDIIDSFIEYLFPRRKRMYVSEAARAAYFTKHDEETGTWEIPYKTRYGTSVHSNVTYGTTRLPALYILERTLNMKSVTVTDEVSCSTTKSGVKRVINQAETVAAIEKQKLLIREFQDWVWKDETRKKRLEDIFDERYGCVRRRCYDGSFLSFPRMAPDFTLFPYQKDAVARILFSPNTLLAHDVGSGKTYIMAAAGMELKRMGLSEKNLYVVPNNIVGQWRGIFEKLYPEAKLLVVSPKDFEPAKRQKVLRRMRDENFDGIIIAYSCFDQIPLSRDSHLQALLEEQAKLTESLRKVKNQTNGLQRRLENLNKRLAEAALKADAAKESICFDSLGITRLFVDEAHNFKNVPIHTQTDRVLGVASGGSKKCQQMLEKVRFVQRSNNGGGVVFATGTPITNSVTDAYVMQLYLQSGELALLDLQSFDGWIGMFAERETQFEIDVDTSSYRLATRFSKFHNLPELTTLLSSIADFHRVEVRDGIPEHDGYEDALLEKTEEFGEYLHKITERAEAVRTGKVKRTEDNMLNITTDGRKAALDIRLVMPEVAVGERSKAARCAENVAAIYFDTMAERSAQIVFCDTSTPKDAFNLYDELREKLVQRGIPEGEIAYIHDALSEPKRNSLFAKVRSGRVRVLIGSTFKLGLGVNIQDRLIALHHLDVPWRPADMTQREGRILRQGNRNKTVKLYRYITEGSFDAYSWQLLETKARFIADLLSGSLSERSNSDIENTVLSYAEVKALAVGNPLVKRRVETANELSRLSVLQRRTVDERLRMEQELAEIPNKRKHQKTLIADCLADKALYEKWMQENPAPTDALGKKAESEKRRELRRQLAEALAGNCLETEERVLLKHRGFDIVLPAGMSEDKPYVWLCGTGRYYVELGDTEVGNLIRIENFLDTLEAHLAGLRSGLAFYAEREKGIRTELAKKKSYLDEIAQCRQRLAQIDEELGVSKDE